MPKAIQNPVTPAARAAFELYLRQWQERLGLQDWRVVISDKPTRNAAELYRVDLEARTAVIRLGRDFGAEPVDDATLEDTAVHELLHLLLHELKEFTADPTAKDADRMSAEHRVVHTLVNLLVHQR